MTEDSVYKIILIGAGQLGSRHLQALAKLDLSADITVIDPSVQALSVARERLQEVGITEYIRKISFSPSFEESNGASADLVIVATTADVRVPIARQLLTMMKINNILFEKVLCQSEAELNEISHLIQSHNINAWVNCPRRLYPFYVELKKLFSPGETIAYYLQGGEWGLACNAVHFIDHVAFLSGGSEFKIDVSRLDSGFMQSKRENFIELTGSMGGTFENGSEFMFLSRRGSDAPHRIYIQSAECHVIIDETRGQAQVARRDNDWQWNPVKFRAPFQSELTHIVARDILRESRCDLTTFEESCRIHKPFLEAILGHLNKDRGQIFMTCPIT